MQPEGFVAVTGESSSSCGYCHSKNDTSHSFGAWAYKLSVSQYQALIDRGWRRSGQYLYKPNISTTCCPPYTIRLDASQFKPRKSHKRVIKKMGKFLGVGKQQINSTEPSSETFNNEILDIKMAEAMSEYNEVVDKHIKPISCTIQKKTSTNVAKELEQLIQEAEATNTCHQLRIELTEAAFEQDSFQLYCKYQTAVHKDPPSKLTPNSYKNFLVDNPLVRVPATEEFQGFGAFHQKYYIDNQLIAVAILDILPKCVSSVYFMYDPAFSFLSLGVYSALREIYLVKSLQEYGIQYYYMGYYIHSCPKMKYKGQYIPSDLLCPKNFEWVPLDQCVKLLDESKVVCLSDSSSLLSDGSVQVDLKGVLVLYRDKLYQLEVYF